MRRPANAARMACGHPMCDPGSAECRTRDALGATPEQVEQLRAAALAALDPPHGPGCTVAAPCAECRPRAGRFYREGNDLAAADAGALRTVPRDLLDQLVDEIRAERDQHLDVDAYQAWRREYPGRARLLDLTDRI